MSALGLIPVMGQRPAQVMPVANHPKQIEQSNWSTSAMWMKRHG
jgi:hypothetical protein